MGSNKAGLNHQQGCWPINKAWGYFMIIEGEYYWIYIYIIIYIYDRETLRYHFDPVNSDNF
jgi:hypothetical protein